jgi:hypothetical protein
MKSIIFWDVTPCSLLSCNRRFGGIYRLHLQGRINKFSLPPACLLVLAEIISSTLTMEAICSSETSVATQQTTRRHIPEDDTLPVKNECLYIKVSEIPAKDPFLNNSFVGYFTTPSVSQTVLRPMDGRWTGKHSEGGDRGLRSYPGICL